LCAAHIIVRAVTIRDYHKVYGHTVEIMGQVAKDSARTSRKALSCGGVIAWVWTGPHNYGDCRKVEGRTGSLGDPLWGKPVSATGVLGCVREVPSVS
jgi:hypothetical protein